MSRASRAAGSVISPRIARTVRAIWGSIFTLSSPHCPLGQLNMSSATITMANPQATRYIKPRTNFSGRGAEDSSGSCIRMVPLGQVKHIVMHMETFMLEQSEAGTIAMLNERRDNQQALVMKHFLGGADQCCSNTLPLMFGRNPQATDP